MPSITWNLKDWNIIIPIVIIVNVVTKYICNIYNMASRCVSAIAA